MVALKMVVDGALVVLKVSPVVGGARGRGAADRGWPNVEVSRKVATACDVRSIRCFRASYSVPRKRFISDTAR